MLRSGRSACHAEISLTNEQPTTRIPVTKTDYQRVRAQVRTGQWVLLALSLVDVEFPAGELPEIHNSLHVHTQGSENPLVIEVQQHLSDAQVRCVAMDATDGLRRGQKVTDTASPITTPVGTEVLGRIFNVLGQPIDGGDTVDEAERLPIHRPPPQFSEQVTEQVIFETGIKVIDLIAPLPRGGKVGVIGGAGVGKTVLLMEPVSYTHLTLPPNREV